MLSSAMAFCPSNVRQFSSVILHEQTFGDDNHNNKDTQERRQFISTVGSATAGLWLGGGILLPTKSANALQSGAAGKLHSYKKKFFIFLPLFFLMLFQQNKSILLFLSFPNDYHLWKCRSD